MWIIVSIAIVALLIPLPVDTEDQKHVDYVPQKDTFVYSTKSPLFLKPIEANNENRKIGYTILSEYGIMEWWNCLDILWIKESRWEHTIWNTQGSGAYGIAQALPRYKMKSAGEDYMTNPETQIRWGVDYIKRRYGNACNALSFHNTYNWY